MNAHNMMHSGAFGLSEMLHTQNHRTDDFSTLYAVWTYTWNDRNEMTGFSEKNSSGTVIASGTYTYDSLDRRIGVDEKSGGTTTQTWIVYNGNSNTPYAEFIGSGTLLERYLAGPSYVPGVTGMIARTNASGVTDRYLTGKLGSAPDIVDTSGTVIDHISYGAFGSIRAETNPSSGSQFKFDGMQYDSITGLYNDWHRGYSADFGKFISVDPIALNSNDVNLYRFSQNNTVNFIDDTGNSDDSNPNDAAAQAEANSLDLLTTKHFDEYTKIEQAYVTRINNYIALKDRLNEILERGKFFSTLLYAIRHQANLEYIGMMKEYNEYACKYNQVVLLYNLQLQNKILRNNIRKNGSTPPPPPQPVPTAPWTGIIRRPNPPRTGLYNPVPPNTPPHEVPTIGDNLIPYISGGLLDPNPYCPDFPRLPKD